MSLSARIQLLGSHGADFHDICCLTVFRKNRRDDSSFIKSLARPTGTLYKEQQIFISNVAEFFLE
jgi:hypothetical protein